MDLSKLKIELYDFLGLLLPGLVVLIEVWIALSGWGSFASGVKALNATGLTLLLIISFSAGHLVQELADQVIKRLKGPRFFRQWRDAYWESDEAKMLRKRVSEELGGEIDSVDAAFDYCLSKIEGRFAKRDVFLATSDLSRTILVAAVLGVIPATRVALDAGKTLWGVVASLCLGYGMLILVGILSWTRLTRFRELSETRVFRVYLATPREKSGNSASM
jgi:hypothetical protein